MTPLEIYNSIKNYIGKDNIICNLHSACKNSKYLCEQIASNKNVLDFDAVSHKWCEEKSISDFKSVDAVTNSVSNNYFCFIELKSWKLFLRHNQNESDIDKQAKKYESDLPNKLQKSIELCKEITKKDSTFKDCSILFILLTDISDKDGISSIDNALTALAGTASNLKTLCNKKSKDVLDKISNIETRYWECKEFDEKIAKL